MMAAESSSAAIVQELISAGAEVNGRYITGTALTLAAENNKPDIVQSLLDSGADPSLTLPVEDSELEFAGKTALEIAKAKKFKKIVAILESHGKPVEKNAVAQNVSSVAESWEQLEKTLKKRKLTKSMRLNPSTTAAELKKFARKWKVKLPQDFIDSYLIHNGQSSGGESLIPPSTGARSEGEYRLLALDEIDIEWSMWKDLVDLVEFKSQSSDPEKGIRDDWWSVGWIPFASDGGGDSICLDLKPAKGGHVGQVITMNHEVGERKLLANSFAEWLADLTESLGESE